MEDKIDESDKGLITSNLNLKQDETIEENDTNININNIIREENKIEYLDIDRKRSTDSTSFSISQIEILSQNSESSYSNNIKENIHDIKDEKINYFSGIDNYFYKIMPDKFIDYKKTKNYLIKKEKDKEGINNNSEKSKEIIDTNNGAKRNDNKLYPPVYGNMAYYSYNSFCYNYPFINIIRNANECKREKEEEEDEKDEEIYIIERIPNRNEINRNYYKEKREKINLYKYINKKKNNYYYNKYNCYKQKKSNKSNNYNFHYNKYNNK